MLLLAAGEAFALDILLPGASAPEKVVSIRKFAMMANGANVADLRAKIGSGATKAVVANARSIASVGSLLAPAFTDTLSSVYPVQGSRYFFKVGTAADFQAAARNLVMAAEELVAVADKEDRAGIDAQVARLQGTCGACHAAFRGQNYRRWDPPSPADTSRPRTGRAARSPRFLTGGVGNSRIFLGTGSRPTRSSRPPRL